MTPIETAQHLRAAYNDHRPSNDDEIMAEDFGWTDPDTNYPHAIEQMNDLDDQWPDNLWP